VLWERNRPEPRKVSECKEEHIKWLHDILKMKSISVNIARLKKLKKSAWSMCSHGMQQGEVDDP
jgi:hypothetical protein